MQKKDFVDRDRISDMDLSSSLRDRISIYHGAITAVFIVSVVLVQVIYGPLSQVLAVLLGISVIFCVGSTFNVVRAHSLYHLLSAIYTVVVFGGLYLSTGSDSVGLLAVMGFALLGVAVETYNYRNGTSYLRFDITN